MSEIENLKIGNDGTLHIVGNEDIVANAWAAGKTYVKNKSYVIREHRLYVCNVTHTSVEPFDATKWTEITVIGAIDNALNMTDTASGAIATFESEYALPLQDCTIAINAVQESGTPTPSSPKLISGFTGANVIRCGKNLFSFEKAVLDSANANVYLTPDGYIRFITNASRLKYNIKTSNVVTFTATVASETSNINIIRFKAYYTDGTNGELASVTTTDTNDHVISGTSTSGKTIYQIWSEWNNGVVTYLKQAQLELGSTATDYEAYNGNTYTVDFGQTVYGGSLDVTSGVLTVDRASVTLNGSEEWNNKTGLANIFSYSDPSIKDWGGNLTAVSKIMADTLPTISQTAMVKGTYGICSFSWGHQICVRVENISSAVDLKTYLRSNPLQAVYELTTPQTIQLTPTQISAIVGTNNVFTDTNGDTSLEYYTKRGEQTVRIAEGVAVDVINNKNIDNLTTTNKTLVGAVNEVDGKTTVIDVIPNITMQNGYTLANSRLIKVGQMLVGILEISRSTAFANNDVMAKFPYFDSNFNIVINSFCSTIDRWNALTPCNVFINNSNGNLIFANNISNVKFVRIPFAIALP